MFDHITRERPRVLIIAARNDLRIIATFQFTANGAKTTEVSLTAISRADGSAISAPSPGTWPTTIRELTNNITSGLFELSHACDEQGARLDPITGDEWTAVCNNLREARVNQSRAQATVNTTRQAFRDAEWALAAAGTALIAAERAFNNAI